MARSCINEREIEGKKVKMKERKKERKKKNEMFEERIWLLACYMRVKCVLNESFYYNQAGFL